MIARHQRHARFFHELLRFCFQTHGLNGRCGWTNEHQSCFDAGLCKGFVLAQEAIARVNSLSACGLGCFNDGFPSEVTVFWSRAAHMNGFVASSHVLGMGVGV